MNKSEATMNNDERQINKSEPQISNDNPQINKSEPQMNNDEPSIYIRKSPNKQERSSNE
jgi:hypothetical protein